jgi:hypothetical protein
VPFGNGSHHLSSFLFQNFCFASFFFVTLCFAFRLI